MYVIGMSAHARKSERERERECASKNAQTSQQTEVRDSERGEREYAYTISHKKRKWENICY